MMMLAICLWHIYFTFLTGINSVSRSRPLTVFTHRDLATVAGRVGIVRRACIVHHCSFINSLSRCAEL